MVTCHPTEEVGRVTSDRQKKDSVRGVFERAGPQKKHQKVGRVTSDHLTPSNSGCLFFRGRDVIHVC